MLILLHKLANLLKMREGGQNWQNLAYVVYGCPPVIPYLARTAAEFKAEVRVFTGRGRGLGRSGSLITYLTNNN